MANTQTIGGFQPVRSKIAKTQGRIVAMIAADRSAQTTNNCSSIYLGDAVTLSSGKLIPSYTGISGGIFGVAVGFGVINSMDPLSVPLAYAYNNPQGPNYAPLTTKTGVAVFVALAVDWIFKVQTNTPLSYYVGSTADIGAASGASSSTTAHGSETTGQSTMTMTTDSNHDMEIIENLYVPSNDNTLTYGQYLIAFKPVATYVE